MPETVTITFHKGGAKKQNSVVIESAKQKLVFKAWNHGIIPHEMVHYGVESIFHELKGFISLIGKGLKQEEIEGRKGGLAAGYIECLVGAFQYELSGMSPTDNETFIRNFSDFTKNVEALFSAEDFFEFAPDPARIEAGRKMLQKLTDQWRVLPDGEEIKFLFKLLE